MHSALEGVEANGQGVQAVSRTGQWCSSRERDHYSKALLAARAYRKLMRRSDHHVLLLGLPGVGTSRLTRRLTTILPTMTPADALDTTRIPRVAGRTGDRPAVVTTRPCCALTTPPRMWDGSVGVSADAG